MLPEIKATASDRKWGLIMIQPFSVGRALVIGISEYQNEEVANLPSIVAKDATDIYSLLVDRDRCGYDSNRVKLLTNKDATTQNIREKLDWLASESLPNETVVIFFSGHGVRVGPKNSEVNYLVPYDFDYDDLESKAIASSELTQALSKIKAQRVLVLLDACHSGGTGEVKSNLPDNVMKSGLNRKMYESLLAGSGRVIIASSRTDQLSWAMTKYANSVFTHFLLEGLRGAALRENDQFISVFGLFEYVSDNVPMEANQQPLLKSHNLEKNFGIALVGQHFTATTMKKDGTRTTTVRINGACMLALQSHISNIDRDWIRLATILDIPRSDQNNLRPQFEIIDIITWLERLGVEITRPRLRSAFEMLGWGQALEILNRQSP